jgi:TonB-dependent SusC/RagA subfamily outer membrane receptor
MILNLYNSKDASAAAIYGSRAANGVIITTKKGTKGRESKF